MYNRIDQEILSVELPGNYRMMDRLAIVIISQKEMTAVKTGGKVNSPGN